MPWDAVKFRQRLDNSGMSQSELARETGFPLSTITRLADRIIIANPTIDKAETIARALGCQVQDLLSIEAPFIKARPLEGEPGSVAETAGETGTTVFKSARPVKGNAKRGSLALRSVHAVAKDHMK